MTWLKSNGRVLVLALLLGGNVLVWWQASAFSAREPVLKVAFLDVGQGDAIYVEAPNGNQVLIDGGRDRRVLRALGEVMPWNDKTLDLIIATHPDADHIGGLPAVLERYQVAGIMHNGNSANTQTYKNFLSRVNEEQVNGAKIIYATRGTKVDLGGKVFLTILYPLTAADGVSNDSSVIAYLTDDHHHFLLMGDAPLAAENYLLTHDRELVDVEVLKVGHHGSRTSSGSNFLRAASPRYAVISAGLNNSYGHPHKEVLTRLAQVKAHVLSTATEGTVVCESARSRLLCRAHCNICSPRSL